MTDQTVANMADDIPLETAELHIAKAGTNIPSGWVITLAGPGHPQTIVRQDKNRRERLHREADIEQSRVNGRKWKAPVKSPEEERRETVAEVVGRIVSWTPVDFGKGPVAFSQENAIDLFMDPAKGAYFGQIVDYLTAESAFTRGSAKA